MEQWCFDFERTRDVGCWCAVVTWGFQLLLGHGASWVAVRTRPVWISLQCELSFGAGGVGLGAGAGVSGARKIHAMTTAPQIPPMKKPVAKMRSPRRWLGISIAGQDASLGASGFLSKEMLACMISPEIADSDFHAIGASQPGPCAACPACWTAWLTRASVTTDLLQAAGKAVESSKKNTETDTKEYDQ